MVFKMKDGTTLVNHLQGFCPDLKFTGFAWQMPSGDTNVCEKQSTFRVLQSGQICTLGKFDPPTGGKSGHVHKLSQLGRKPLNGAHASRPLNEKARSHVTGLGLSG